MSSEILQSDSNETYDTNVVAVSDPNFSTQYALIELKIKNTKPPEYHTYDHKGKYLKDNPQKIILFNFSEETLTISHPPVTVHAIGGDQQNQYIVTTIHKNSKGFINASTSDTYDKTLKGKLEKLANMYDSVSNEKWKGAVLFCYMGHIDACDHISNYSEQLTQLVQRLDGKFCIAVKSSHSKIIEQTTSTKQGTVGGSHYRLLSSGTQDLDEFNQTEAAELFEKGIDVIDSNISFNSYWNLAFGTVIHKKTTAKYPVYFNDKIFLNFIPHMSQSSEFCFISDSTLISTSNTEKALHMSTTDEENTYCMMIIQVQPGSLKMTFDPNNKAHRLINNILNLNKLTNLEMIKILETPQEEVERALATNFTDNFEKLHKQASDKIVSKFYQEVAIQLNNFIEGTRKRKKYETPVEPPPKVRRVPNIEMPPPAPMRAQSYVPSSTSVPQY